MPVATTSAHMAPEIRTLLDRLRRRVQLWVLTDTALGLAGWALLTFWVFLALDYGPVVLWASELPVWLRAVFLAGVLGGYLTILYRRWLRRALARLPDESLALVVERRFEQFEESLITAVQLAPKPDQPYSRDMLAITEAVARSYAPQVRPGQLLVWKPLIRQTMAVALLLLPLTGLYAMRPDVVRLGLERMYGLSDEPWPRRAHIQMVGIQVEHRSVRSGEQVWSNILPFQDGEVKVARGARLIVHVRAAIDAERVPETCRILYRTEDGAAGRVAMRRDGAPRDGFQYFSYDEKPFRGVLGDIRFDVVGADHRLRHFTIKAVDAPAVIETELECVFPSYLVDEAQGLWLPRRMPYRSSGMSLPRGTRVLLHMKTNKPLLSAEIAETSTGQFHNVNNSGQPRQELTYEIPALEGNVALEISLRDTDNVLSDSPHRVVLTAIEDKPPELNLTIRGIGSAVTPQVVIPVEGTIQDDYRVAEAWFEYQRNDEPAAREPLAVARDGSVAGGLDFRQLRARQPPVMLEPGQKLFVTIKARDLCDLASGPNVAAAERLELEVVTPEELLIRLDRRELAERRRLEHVLDELTQTRDSLIRVQNEILGVTAELDPRERPPTGEAGASSGTGPRIDLRAIRIQQALRQCQKSASEVMGIAAVLNTIREELINNRVDAEDRKSRLKELVVDPLRRIGEERFTAWEKTLAELEKAVALQQQPAVKAEQAINEANQLIAELNQVLEAMLNIESYNELVEIVRNLIKEQERILEETQKARKQEALELLK
ncbi:MAG: polyketide synthase [Pirellulaceae bacterium]|nr:MAG: polyketide synthase [Pirellulaceae bacterium]